jgi:hypothetical protein
MRERCNMAKRREAFNERRAWECVERKPKRWHWRDFTSSSCHADSILLCQGMLPETQCVGYSSFW